ncbi:MAG: TetR/AcrR family transcriptional regulator [Myxococcales bacterium]|nr:TetR/AcrR family transcriptional regulator [Myxococcales bacterium]
MPPPRRAARRRDAEENRARVVAAARELFAEEGFEVPLDAIARRAGVGRATLYRNFPDRGALAAEIFDGNLRELEAQAAALGERADALLELLRAIVDMQVEAHAMVPALLQEPRAPDLAALERRVRRLLAAPLRRAKAAGQVREDLAIGDVTTGLAMIAAVTGDTTVAARRRRARRALELLLYGLLPRGESDTSD